jgi:hypothetical protein
MRDAADPPEIHRCADSPKAERAEALALGLMGLGPLDRDALAEGVGWDASGRTHMGRDAVVAAIIPAPARRVDVDQTVTHGKAAAVSGVLTLADGSTRLFCHMIRYTSAAATTVAHIVSFEHGGPKR